MTIEELEHSRLEKIASEYRAKGYTVALHPGSGDLPQFLSGFQPDLIAVSNNDKVVVELKSRGGDANEIGRIADAVYKQPGWRFELVVVSLPVAPDVPATGELAPDRQIREYLDKAEALMQQGQVEAAALLAWSALEAILRRRAYSEGLDIVRQSSSRVLKNLYSLGRVDPSTYDKLLRLMEFRNAVAHGFQSAVDASNVKELIAEIRHLQAAA